MLTTNMRTLNRICNLSLDEARVSTVLQVIYWNEPKAFIEMKIAECKMHLNDLKLRTVLSAAIEVRSISEAGSEENKVASNVISSIETAGFHALNEDKRINKSFNQSVYHEVRNTGMVVIMINFLRKSNRNTFEELSSAQMAKMDAEVKLWFRSIQDLKRFSWVTKVILLAREDSVEKLLHDLLHIKIPNYLELWHMIDVKHFMNHEMKITVKQYERYSTFGNGVE